MVDLPLLRFGIVCEDIIYHCIERVFLRFLPMLDICLTYNTSEDDQVADNETVEGNETHP